MKTQNDKPSGTVKQGRRPMYKSFEQERLEKAAPVLLEALRRALPALQRDCLTSSPNGTLIAATAAIAAATGGRE